jgi:drug/metabolite transporter (DMT)-like permease
LEALVFAFSKKFEAKMSAAQYLAIAQIAAAVVMWFCQGIYLRQTSQLDHLTIKGIAATGFVSIVACVLCYAVIYWLLNHIDGHRRALFDGFHTLSATFFGYILFEEPIRALMFVGGMLILAGLVTGNLPRPDSTDAAI